RISINQSQAPLPLKRQHLQHVKAPLFIYPRGMSKYIRQKKYPNGGSAGFSALRRKERHE
ncbi:MAG: hypothetical protein AAB380_02745, partial [Verrucomicrobiota bacterium]